MAKRAILKVLGPEGHSQEFHIEDTEYSVGRDDGQVKSNRFAIREDPLLSRNHFTIQWHDSKLTVLKCKKAKNPIFFQGKECEEFLVEPGQSFLSGKTRFSLQLAGSGTFDSPTTEFTLARTQLPTVQRPNLQECFTALVDMLPELRTCTSNESAFRSALKVLKGLVPDAAEIAILRLGEEAKVLCQEMIRSRTESTPPSGRLLERAFELSSTVTHVWAKAELGSDSPSMTMHSQADWAMASPIDLAGQERFALYVVGTARQALSETEASVQKEYLDGLASLADVVASTLEHHLAVARFNRIEGQVVKFFSPALRKSVAGSEYSSVLKPRRRRVTVLFFDLRGFSRATEKSDDDLDSILNHHEVLTEVMTAVTDCVFSEGGVVIDYQGDAVMACWGTLVDDCEANKAVRAARAIVQKISQMSLPFGDGANAAMRCGIGLATGDVIAGQVGAREQAKFGVLGSTVNLASRLEGLTKYFRVPILINEETRRELGDSTVCRRVGLVRPAGLDNPCEIFELVLERDAGGSGLSPDEVVSYEEASTHYANGEMEQAYQALMAGSRPTDPIARFLARHILDCLDYGVPKNFDGVLTFRAK